MKLEHILSKIATDDNTAKTLLNEVDHIEGDLVGTPLFNNILISFGAFITSLFILIFAATFTGAVIGFSFRHIWVAILLAACISIGLGFWSYSKTNLFRFRLSSILMISGKLFFIMFIFERISESFSRQPWHIMLIASLCMLILAISNLWVAKSKFDAFAILATSFLIFPLVQADIYNAPLLAYYIFDFIQYSFAAWAFYVLFKEDSFTNRLPIYALFAAYIAGKIISIENFNVFMPIDNFELNIAAMTTAFVKNSVYLLATVYLVSKLTKTKLIELEWQYYIGFIILIMFASIGATSMLIIIFGLIYGFHYKDQFILKAAYLLAPVYVFGLYYTNDMTLNIASAFALAVGTACLMAYMLTKTTNSTKRVK